MNQKTLLAVGDSLVAGNIGASFLKNISLLNKGADGIPLKGILNRLEMSLKLCQKKGTLPQALLIEGGTNDILLPWMEKQNPLEWSPFIKTLSRHQQGPIEDPSFFQKELLRGVVLAESYKIPHIILMTIPTITEDKNHTLFLKKELYNTQIRTLAAERGLDLLDAEAIFKEHMKPTGNSFLFISPNEIEADRLRFNKEGGNSICYERDLQLTIDGVHLNERGASLIASPLELILKA